MRSKQEKYDSVSNVYQRSLRSSRHGKGAQAIAEEDDYWDPETHAIDDAKLCADRIKEHSSKNKEKQQ